ncbi:DUF986 family protein [Rappaport israeli]|uniref:DUF986 family protein n=1 Tax=Rappaport israeli TaxID=1839807 RepID=UPI00092FEDDE|nr:DUF986 family protein [Rappaport israeli]
MSLTPFILFILVLGYSLFLLYDGPIQANRHGKTLVSVRLRRRLVDSLFFSLILLSALSYEFTHSQDKPTLIALILLLALVLYQGLRYPRWRLKQHGFTAGGRYYRYPQIQAMRLSEDGVLLLTLDTGLNLILPIAHIDDLEKAAAFFTGEEALKHLIPTQEQS